MSTEQRKHTRYSVEVAAEVDIRGNVVAAATQNVSSGGVALVLDRPLIEGTGVGLTLFLTQDGIEDPDEEPFEGKASVVWHKREDGGAHVVGVRFEQVNPSQSQLLQRFLAALQSG